MLRHMSYNLPLPPGTQKCWLVERRKFEDLLREPRIVIPIFQRTYCWSDAQISGWWHDLLHSKGDLLSGHSVGKIMFKRTANDLCCIDGQQRITTTMLFLAALRDACCQLQPSPASTQHLIRRLNSVLYRDVAAFDEVRSSKAPVSSLFPVGHLSAFSRLLPSYRDRAPFFELITIGALAEQPLPLSTEARATVLYRAKHHFDDAIAAHMCGYCSMSEKFVALQTLADRALTFFSAMYMECIHDINLPQLFLWLQEKTLFSMGSLLWNPTPGVKFHMCDMARNLLMSAFCDLPTVDLERLYASLWVPLECQHSSLDSFDDFLIRYLMASETTAANSSASAATLPLLPLRDFSHGKGDRYVGEFERGLIAMIAGCAHQRSIDDLLPALRYARFQSHYEALCQQHDARDSTGTREVITNLLRALGRYEQGAT